MERQNPYEIFQKETRLAQALDICDLDSSDLI